jgi:hypothetical protein
MAVESEPPRPAVLQRLSDDFEMCVFGLGEVRREWERRGGDSDAVWPLLIN